MLKKQQLKIAIRLLISIGVLAVLSVAANIILLKQNQNLAQEQTRIEEKFDQKIIALGQEQFSLARQINFIANVTDASLDDITLLRAETTKQLEEVQSLNQTALNDAQNALRDELNENIQSSNDRIVSITEDWDSVVVQIECRETTTSSRGSGVLFTIDGQVSLVTNRHVVADNDDVLIDDCSVMFPIGQAEDFDFTSSDISFDLESSDITIIQVPSPSQLTRTEAKSDTTWCTENPAIGDEIAVLGYPAIGAKDSLTVTEGIISGYDGKYFISSAKVDKGNSGGAAIWLENNCYLGIPTKTHSGVAEALARILNIQGIEF